MFGQYKRRFERKKTDHSTGQFVYEHKNISRRKIEVRPPISRAGDKIVLMTEANLRLGIAACSVSESFCNGGECTPLKIVIQDDESDFTAL